MEREKREFVPGEIRASRLVLVEPGTGRPRAVLETVPETREDRTNGGGRSGVVRLSLLTPAGDVVLSIEVGADGRPRLFVGDPDRGPAVEVDREGILMWAAGNVVAALRSREDGGGLDLCDRDGVPVLRLPGASW